MFKHFTPQHSSDSNIMQLWKIESEASGLKLMGKDI